MATEMKEIHDVHRSNGSDDAELDDVNSHDEGSQRSNSSSSSSGDDEIMSSNDDGDSDRSFGSDDDSYCSGSSYYDSSDDRDTESDGSRSTSNTSHNYESSERSSNYSSSASDSDQATALHSNTRSKNNNYSTKRSFYRGVLPIMSHGYYLGGDDQNSDPNRNNMLIQRRGKSASSERLVDSSNDGETVMVHQQSQTEPHHRSDNNDSRRSRRRRRDNHRSSSVKYEWKKEAQTIKCCVKYLCCQTQKRSTKILVGACVLWILAQCYYFYFWSWRNERFNALFGDTKRHQRNRGMSGRERKVLLYQSGKPLHHRDMLSQPHSPEEMAILRQQLMQEAHDVLGTAAGDDFDPTYYQRDNGGKPDKLNNRRHRGVKSRDSGGSSRSERIREGCAALEWHSFHFPNCNEIHEINLQNVVRRRRRRQTSIMKNGNFTAVEPDLPWGFVGNGLWRDVFACDPREEAIDIQSPASGSAASLRPLAPAVLKVMKSEHVSIEYWLY